MAQNNKILSIRLIVLLSGGLFFSSFFRPNESKSNPVSALKLVVAMLDSIHNIKTLSFQIKAYERIENNFISAESKVKISMKPHMIYFRNEKKKIFILWQEGLNGGNAEVKSKMSLGTALSLDPHGNLMRKNQHYTIFELGFEYFAKVFSTTLAHDKDNLNKNLVYVGKKILREKNCFVLAYEDKNFGYMDYKTAKNESVSSIAAKFNTNDYAIRSKNNLHSFYGNIKEGTLLKIPNNYCKKIILYLDETTLLPMNMTSFDDVGLYENYEYSKVEMNKKINKEDFLQFYKD